MPYKLPVADPGAVCSRRALLKGIGIVTMGTLLLDGCADPGSSLPAATTSMCGANLCVDLGDAANAELLVIDGALLIDAPNDTIMVIRTSETAVIALSAICTHSRCSMNFVPTTHEIDCPCHGSRFGEDGHVIKGPARRALRVYAASLADNVITVVIG